MLYKTAANPTEPIDTTAKQPAQGPAANGEEVGLSVKYSTHIHIAPYGRAVSSKIRLRWIELHDDHVLTKEGTKAPIVKCCSRRRRAYPEPSGKKLASIEGLAEIWKNLGAPGKGAAIGLAAMLPFLPGMLGSRKKGDELRDIYSGVEPVPIRAGRWWEVGSTAFEGARIKEWRPHWNILHKSHAEDAALYGSEAEKWKHNPVLHPRPGGNILFP